MKTPWNLATQLSACIAFAVATALQLSADPVILGNNADSTVTDTITDPVAGPFINGNGFQATANLRITEIRAKIGSMNGGHIKCAIYSGTADSPDALLGSTAEVTNPSDGWQSFALPTPLTLKAGGYYWLTIWSDSADARVYFTPGGSVRWNPLPYGDWPSTLTLPGGPGDATYCIYAEDNLLPATESIFPSTIVPGGRANDAPNWELGTVFQSTVPGTITHARVFALADEGGDHVVRIWRNSDNAVIFGPATWSFGGSDEWITLDIPDLTIEANTEYTISISSPLGWYPYNAQYFAAAGGNSKNLVWPQAAGVFSEIAGQRPTTSFGNTAYLRDVVFVPGTAGDTSYSFDDVNVDFFGIDGSHGGTDFGNGIWQSSITIGGFDRPASANKSPGVFTLPAGKVLKAIRLSSSSGGTWQLSDGVNPDLSGTFAANDAPELVLTGWEKAGAKISVKFSAPPSDGYIDDITYGKPPTPFRVVDIKTVPTSKSVSLVWEGDGPQFQVEKSTSLSGPFQSVSQPLVGHTFTDPGVLGNAKQSFYRIRQGTALPPADCITTPTLDAWVNTAFAAQINPFEVQFDATPSEAGLDCVMALSSGPTSEFSGFACLTRFTPAGKIDARNGASYTAANSISYVAHVTYHFRMVVNVPAHTYSIYVTPAGGTEQTVGVDYAFRAEQSTVASLGNWGVIVASDGTAGNTTVCNFKVFPLCSTTPAPGVWVNTPFATQTGGFTVEFTATPSVAPIDSVMALSPGPRFDYPVFPCLVRFNGDSGFIDARNGGAYEAQSEIPYLANVSYTFRVVVDIPAQTYSVFVTPAGEPEATVGTDFAFRPTAGTVTDLSNWAVVVDRLSKPGTNTVCGFKILP